MKITFFRLAALAVALFCTPVHAADSVASFYKGKTITLMIGSGPGGGYDRIGRLLARHLGRHIPGNPSFVAQNMPGAGSLVLTNHLYNKAPKDGTTIGVVTNGMPTAPIFTPKQAKFNSSTFNWIGSPSAETQIVMVWHTAKVQTIGDLFTKELIVGGVSPGTATVDMPLVINSILGTKFKIVAGYKGNSQIDLAMERGEVEGQAANGWVTAKVRNAPWLSSGKAKIIAQYGVKKNRELPNVPLFDLPKDKNARQAIEVMFARQEFGRPLIAPPGIPADRIKALRDAYAATMKDPVFLADAKKSRFEIDPITGEELARLTKLIMTTPKDVGERLRGILASAGFTRMKKKK